MDKERMDFEQRFEQKTVEILVLIKENVGGAAVYGNYLRPSVGFLASVDVNTGELSEKKGRLEWLIKKEPGRKGWGYGFCQYGIYHMKVRKCIPVELQSNMSKAVNNRYMVVEVLEDGMSDARLEEIRERISKPVQMEDKLGTFTLDREFSWFEGEIDWLGKPCRVYLETDEEDGDTGESALAALKELHRDLKAWDCRFREFAAEKLTGLANDWQEDTEGAESAEITREQFAARLEISEVSVSPEGHFTLYYDDDDMFWGHSVEVDARISGEMADAAIVG